MIESSAKSLSLALCAIAVLAIQGCAAGKVANAAVSTTVFAGKTVVKGTVGASKLVYKGGKAVAGAGRNGNADQAYTGGPAGSVPPSCLEANGSYTAAIEDANGEYYCAG